MEISPGFNAGDSRCITSTSSLLYQKLPQNKELYLAYVVAIRDPLNYHLDIYWPKKLAERYSSTIQYDYTFVSEELGEGVYRRQAVSCHMRGVEIIQRDEDDFTNMKEAYLIVSKRILRAGGWVVVSVGDIDVYKRILIDIHDIGTGCSLNEELLSYVSSKTGENIAKEYVRPLKLKSMFKPQVMEDDYHIVYENKK